MLCVRVLHTGVGVVGIDVIDVYCILHRIDIRYVTTSVGFNHKLRVITETTSTEPNEDHDKEVRFIDII